MKRHITLYLCIFYIASSSCIAQQNSCDNIGFENGNFLGWKLEYGRVSTSFWTGNTIYSTPTQGTLNQGHLITSGTGNDPNITAENIPLVAPGSKFSARIGNAQNGGFYDRISRSITVTADNSLFLYRFAIVLQNPDPKTHTPAQQPKFQVRVVDKNGNSDDCNTYEVFASIKNKGFKSQGIGDYLLVYRNWTTAALDLRAYIGQTITITATSSDCTEGGHYGYAYFDAQCLSSKITPSNACSGSGSTTLKAPDGFETYNWSTGDTTSALTINNAVIGTKYTVKVKPYFSISDSCLLTFDYTVQKSQPSAVTVPKTTCNPKDTGTIVQKLTNFSGCDSVVTTITTLLKGRDTTFFKGTSCNPTDTGVVIKKFINFVGCDSFTQLRTILLRGRDTTFLTAKSCNPTDTGVVIKKLTNFVGCDSFVRTKINLLRGRDTIQFIANSCNPIDTGVAIKRFTNFVGCDSFVRLKTVLLRGRDTTFLTSNTCVPTVPGVEVKRFTNAVGCDSFVQLKKVLLRGRDTTFLTTVTCNPSDTSAVLLKRQNIYGCDSFLYFRKKYYPLTMDAVALPTDCSGASGKITVSKMVGGKPPYLYALQDSVNFQSSAVFNNLISQFYTLFVKDSFKCIHQLDNIEVKSIPCNVFVPNIFSPNFDSNNDKFVFYSASKYIKTIKTYRIFNRWGILVYEAPSKNVPFEQFTEWWDGTFKNELIAPDVFIYAIEVEYFDPSIENKVLKGDVTLVR